MKFQTSLFIFTRDLRIDDNTALIEACTCSRQVIPCFVFNPEIIKKAKNYSHRIQFLLESLEDLRKEFAKRKSNLHFFCDDYDKVIEKISRVKKIDSIFINQDNTPFAKKRQSIIFKASKQHSIPLYQYSDHLLYDPDLIKTKEGKPYTVFSHFFRAAAQFPVSKPQQNNFVIHDSEKFESEIDDTYQILVKFNPNLATHGGRKNGLRILDSIKDFEDYQVKRDYPIHKTTMLSAHNRFGTISVRELYHAISSSLGKNHTLISEIHWKEFFSHILYHFPHVTRDTFRQKYSKISWRYNQDHIEAWKNGKTGFPIVDAGMRQLNNTGFMHNRIRMVVASFLSKDLHADWRLGERYFAEKLIDYDLAVNNGNWQWAASTGCDAQPWFRIFNPWLQQRKFDPNCKYITKWIPELESLSKEQIHKLETESFDVDYPRPIVDHVKESKIAKQMFQSLRR